MNIFDIPKKTLALLLSGALCFSVPFFLYAENQLLEEAYASETWVEGVCHIGTNMTIKGEGQSNPYLVDVDAWGGVLTGGEIVGVLSSDPDNSTVEDSFQIIDTQGRAAYFSGVDDTADFTRCYPIDVYANYKAKKLQTNVDGYDYYVVDINHDSSTKVKNNVHLGNWAALISQGYQDNNAAATLGCVNVSGEDGDTYDFTRLSDTARTLMPNYINTHSRYRDWNNYGDGRYWGLQDDYACCGPSVGTAVLGAKVDPNIPTTAYWCSGGAHFIGYCQDNPDKWEDQGEFSSPSNVPTGSIVVAGNHVTMAVDFRNMKTVWYNSADLQNHKNTANLYEAAFGGRIMPRLCSCEIANNTAYCSSNGYYAFTATGYSTAASAKCYVRVPTGKGDTNTTNYSSSAEMSVIYNIYTKALGRTPSTSELVYWLDTLSNREFNDIYELAENMFKTDEFNTHNVTTNDKIKAIFQAMLGRDPSNIDYTTYANQDWATTAYNIIRSGESCSVNNLTANDSTYFIQTKREHVQNLVQTVYKKCFNRTATSDELALYENAIFSGAYTEEQIVKNFFDSQEFKNNVNGDNEVAITKIYQSLLERDPDNVGKQSWLEEIATGKSYSDVAASIMSSNEYTIIHNNAHRQGSVQDDAKNNVNEDTVKQLTISFDANDGEGTVPSNVTYQSNETTVLPSNFLYKEGYAFKAWNTKKDGTGASYLGGQTVSNVSGTLYAIWTDTPTETVEVGIGNSISVTVPNPHNLSVLDVAVSNNDDSVAITALNKASGTVTVTGVREGNDTFVIHVQPTSSSVEHFYFYKVTVSSSNTGSIKKTVSFDANGGEGIQEKVTVASGTNYIVPECSFTKKGYTFSYWFLSDNEEGETVSYKPGDKITVTSNITLIAVWTAGAALCTVTYKANGGSGNDITQTIEKGEQVTIKTNSFTRTGYNFAGWATSADGKVKYKESDKLTVTANTTLYAIWQKKFIDVDENAWYYEPVTRIVALGLMSGYGNGAFGPNDNMTRAQLAVILYNYFGTEKYSSTENQTGLSDVLVNQYYTAAANWAVKNGIITGLSGKYFAPNNSATREQVCVIIARAAQKFCNADIDNVDKTKMKQLQKNGHGTVSSWAENSVAWCINNKILNGVSGKWIMAGQALTRAQAASMIMNAIDNGAIKK